MLPVSFFLLIQFLNLACLDSGPTSSAWFCLFFYDYLRKLGVPRNLLVRCSFACRQHRVGACPDGLGSSQKATTTTQFRN